jgi:putative phage-type endonuclease
MINKQQKEDRKSHLGGSDMAVILGLSSYKTAYELYLEKKGLLEDNLEETQFQYWGNRLENVLKEEFERRNNLEIIQIETAEHPLYPFLKGNLDGYITQLNAVWEAKTSSSFMTHMWGEQGSDIVPMEYLIQLATYCSIKNCDEGYFSVLIGGNDYREYKYKRDRELEEKIIDAACEFWDALQSSSPPPPINQIDLKLMFPIHSKDKCKKINEEIEIDLIQLKGIKSQIKEFEEIEEKARFNIMRYMEDCEVLTDEEGSPLCTWKTNTRGSRTFLLKGK